MSNVTIRTPPLPRSFQNAVASLNDANRAGLHERVAEEVGSFVRSYIREIAPSNHRTALSFHPAARPTGHLEDAARNTVWKGGKGGAEVTVTSPGITRAFHSLQIRATSKMLTIPARTAPEAYGKRAREVALMEPLFLVKARGAGAFLATGDESARARPSRGRRPPLPTPNRPNRPHRQEPNVLSVRRIRPVFWLRAAVTIPQKRDILPSDADLASTSRKGVARALRDFINGRP